MKQDLLRSLENLPYFTITGFRQLLGEADHSDPYARDLLYRWQPAGRILALKRGVYMTTRFYERHRSHADFSLAISAILLPLSYVSLEYILQRQGILSEATYPVTAVTFKNTRTYMNSAGTFVYRHIQKSFYMGFQQRSFAGIFFYQASTAKALFDYFYLRPLDRSLRSKTLDLAEDLRLNLDEIEPETRQEFEGYVQHSASAKMTYILNNLRRTAWRP